MVIDAAIPGDSRIDHKEVKKKTTVVPVVIGALEAIPRNLLKHLKTFGLDRISPSQHQKCSTTGNSSHPAKKPLRFLGPRRGLKLQGLKKHISSRHLMDAKIRRNNNNNNNNNYYYYIIIIIKIIIIIIITIIIIMIKVHLYLTLYIL